MIVTLFSDKLKRMIKVHQSEYLKDVNRPHTLYSSDVRKEGKCLNPLIAIYITSIFCTIKVFFVLSVIYWGSIRDGYNIL